eukprot:gene3733-4654_t
MEGPQRCSVQMTINGETQVMSVGLGPGITVDHVEGKVKNFLGVVDGMLSYHEDSLEMVNGLEADKVYYFVRHRGTQAPPPAAATVAAAATEAVSDVVPTAIDRIVQTPVDVKSPTTAGDHLSDGGFARFVRKPLSLDTSIIQGHQMFVNADADLPFCLSMGHDERVGTLALHEKHYYSFFATYALSGIQQSTLRSGEGELARRLFPGAF